MLLLDLSNCGPSGLLRAIYFFKLLMDIVFILIPIALIILVTIDFSKAVFSSDEDKSKTVKLASKRIFYAVVVFFVPMIVSLVNEILGDLGVNYSACISNLTLEEIEYLESVEYTIDEAEKYVSKASRQLTEESFNKAQTYIDEIEDETKRKSLQNRLDKIKKYKKEKQTTEFNYDGYSSTGACSPNSGIYVLSSEPDPSCSINYWNNYINSDDFIFPELNSKKLGAWPKNYNSIPKNISIGKTYYSGTLIWPVTPDKNLYNFVYEHNGIDIMASIGTPIYAPATGTLLYSEWGHTTNKGSDETAYSVTIIMDNPIVQNGIKYETIFLTHMSGIINRCSSNHCNKKVEKGELLGFVGTAAGSASSGGYAPHLHMTIYPSGSYGSGLTTTKIQSLYGISCGSGCKNINIKAGG